MKLFSRIYIEITNSCNFNCSFCAKSKREPKTMSLNEFKKVANEVKEYTDLITLHVKGEPLLHPEIGNILDVCLEEGLKVNITTNGSLLLKKFESLKKLSLRQLNISIHSISQNETGDINESDYLSNIFEAVKILKEFNPELLISYRLWNLKDIKDNDINLEIIKSLEEYYNIQNLKQTLIENEFLKLKENVFINQDIEFTWPDIELDIINNEGTCMGLRNQIAILSNGDVVPCCLDQDGNIKLGNIFEDDLEDIINSEKCLEIIKGFEENKLIHRLCKTCGFVSKFK